MPSIKRPYLVVTAAVVVCYLLLIAGELTHRPRTRIRWIADDYDVSIYFERAQFLPLRAKPYRDVFSEYPPIATLAFTAPMLLVPAARTNVTIYRLMWSTLMGVCLVVLIAVIARYRVERGLGPWPALILLAPSALYFSLMRFDVLCALVTCLSLASFARRRYGQAYLLLSLGTFLKWYPALLFPVFVAYQLRADHRTRDLRWALVYVTATAAIVAISIAAFTWDGMLVPYRFHLARGSEYFNPYWIIEHRGYSWTPATLRGIRLLFLALQISIVPVLLVRRIRNITEVFQYGVFAIYSFVTFARIDSPQWLLWYLPPALMMARRPATLAVFGTLGFVNYLVFPVAFDTFPLGKGPIFSSVVFFKDVILLVAVILLLRERDLFQPARTVGTTATRSGSEWAST
jgi:hypothetical protein